MQDRSMRQARLGLAIRWGLTAAGSLAAAQLHAAASMPLSTLSASTGVKLHGFAYRDYAGYSVSAAGDVNGDGFDDLIVGAPKADPGSVNYAGSTYVVFGRSGTSQPVVELSALNGTNGFRIDGVGAGEPRSGRTVAGAGDINGDGFDDVILGAASADNGGENTGSAYVVFGHATPFPATLAVSALNGSNGFRLDGATPNEVSGWSVGGAGDVNGDDFDDLIIGAQFASAPEMDASGASYVVFGHTGAFPAVVALSGLNGTTGFRIHGEAAGDRSGFAVAGAGDINGDGFDDIAIGSPFFDKHEFFDLYTGRAHVVFGHAPPHASVFSLGTVNGTNGFEIQGGYGALLGYDVGAAGDVNGDGFDDVAFGAPPAGQGHVIFGHTGAFTSPTGFVTTGAASNDLSGSSISGAGDFNGDGTDDLLVGAPRSDLGASDAGTAFLVFGRTTAFPGAVPLSGLDGTNGMRFDGATSDDLAGRSAAGVGDFNGDGIDDILIGAPDANPGHPNLARNRAGISYIVFGNAAPLVSATTAMLAPVLEDAVTNTGTTIAALGAPLYLDAQPLFGAGIDVDAPVSAAGIWQFSLDGNTWTAIPTGGMTINNALVLLANSRVRFLANANFFGQSPPISMRLWDGADGYTAGTGRNIQPSVGGYGGFSNDANRLSVTAPITAVNDVPAFQSTNPAAVDEDAGAQSVPATAFGFVPGPANESAQTVAEYLVGSVSVPALFSVQPQVTANGTLTYTPAANAFGTSTFQLRVRDSGGTANGGVDTSPAQTLTIEVESVNDAPGFTASNPPVVAGSAGFVSVANWATFNPGAANEGGQTPQYEVVSVGTPALFTVQPQILVNGTSATLQYQPAGANGSSTIQVRVRDSGGTANGGVDTSATQQFTITIGDSAPLLVDGFES